MVLRKSCLGLVCAVSLIGLFIGCKNLGVDSAGGSADQVSQEIVWRDLVSLNNEQSMKFYGSLFGWTFEETAVDGYSWIKHNGNVIGGLVDSEVLKKKPQNGIWLNGFAVDDIYRALNEVIARDGEILRDPIAIPKRGKLAVIKDNNGALIQIISGHPGARTNQNVPEVGSWLWAELLADSMHDAVLFYEGVFGVSGDEKSDVYTMLHEGDRPFAGIVASPFEKTTPVWVPFVRVDDVGALVKKAESLGARVVLKPSKKIRDGKIAIILDPDGAPVAMQQWQPADNKSGDA